MRIQSFLATIGLLGATVGGLALTTATLPVAIASAAEATSTYVPLESAQRLLDTRTSVALNAENTVSVSVTGDAPLPAPGTVVAVVLNLTVLGPAKPGYWTVWPHASIRPEVSNINVDELQALSGPFLALPNLVTVPVGPDGIVDIYTTGGGHAIVDLFGYYTPAASSAAGRFQALTSPTRVLDTRRVSTFSVGETRNFVVPGAAGASAVAINLTALTTRSGYWQLYPQGSSVPFTSNLNSPSGTNAVVANQAIVPVDSSGGVTIYSEGGGDLLIDLVGTFTGAGAPSAADGLFVPLTSPTRIDDTRIAALNPLGGTTVLHPGWRFEVPVTSNPAIGRPDVSAVVLNATTVSAITIGYVSVGTAGDTSPNARPTTSTMNVVRPAQTLANHAIVPISGRGFSMFTEAGGVLIADLAGYYLGTPSPAPFGPPSNPASPACATPTVGFPTSPVGPIINGSSKSAVKDLQNRLLALGFWNGGADGGYGLTTVQSVMAFQKWKGLPATTVVDNATAIALNTQLCRPAAGRSSGSLIEVDKTKQIAYVIQNGQMKYIFNVSTGNGRSYDEVDKNAAGGRVIGVAITPTGTFNTYREYDIVRYEGDLGSLYRPKFIIGGVAIHGSPSIPNYPASHGCVRVANPVMDLIWRENLLPLHSTVWIHD